MTTSARDGEREAERQRLLIERLWAPQADASGLPVCESGERALRGLQAYRVNAAASAARALSSALPTVRMLLGKENFEHMASEFWLAEPPRQGDLAAWGEGAADWIARHEQLVDWPYLADCARLDWAVHRCEQALDDAFDHDSIARLGDTDPSRLAVQFTAGLALVQSPWPIAAIHEAHRQGDEAAFEAVREAVAQQRAESAVVARDRWKGVVQRVDSDTAAFMCELLAGGSIGIALEHAAEGFGFAVWLAAALQRRWLKGIRLLPD